MLTTAKKVALIVGTGMAKFFDVRGMEKRNTQYGECFMGRFNVSEGEALLVPRHGPHYSLPPHRINYRAVLRSVRDAGASSVIATNAVGSINKRMKPGDLVVPDQILDFTRGRAETFFDGDGDVVFTDVTKPYSDSIRSALYAAAKRLKVRVHNRGTYVCTQGPRFETAAEIKMFSRLGGDVVGMTGVPEAFLARELGLEYATLCVVTNWAAGIAKQVSHAEVLDIMEDVGPVVRDVIVSTITRELGE